jgi:hypothetical protein
VVYLFSLVVLFLDRDCETRIVCVPLLRRVGLNFIIFDCDDIWALPLIIKNGIVTEPTSLWQNGKRLLTTLIALLFLLFGHETYLPTENKSDFLDR